jgi:hypothetical protein
LAALPQTLEQPDVAERIHALPESIMLVGGELSVGRQPLEGFRFQAGLVSFEVVKDARLEHEEASVDPAVAGLGFLREGIHQVTVED